MVDIGGRALRAVAAGPPHADRPLVVLEAGSFGIAADWAAVQAKLGAKGLRSLAYDRAGLGYSDPGPEPRDGAAIAADRQILLERLGEAGPFVFCGHSMAGLHARLFAALNRERLTGMVLVDATTPEAMDSKSVVGFVEQFSRASRLAAWGAGAGLLAPLAGTALGDAIGLPSEASGEKRWAFAHHPHNHWAAKEVEAWPQTARQGREAGPYDPNLPIAVIVAGGAGSLSGMRTVQTAPALASNLGMIETVSGANHASMLNDVFADAIVRGVEHVLSG